MKKIETTLHNIGKSNLVYYEEVDSNYGHDAFLVELDKFAHSVTKALEEER